MWNPISLDDLSEQVAASLAQMEDVERTLWEMVRVPPVKWRLHPWGDLGGGFWIVGLIGRRAIWYNDIEHGFNVSPYDETGTIAEYWCNQDELHHVIWQLRQQIETGTLQGRFGPPTPTDTDPRAED
ncbi:MAG: hypothetical protein BGO49_10030 [Planctomycetales bacterium 71-10]|nr:MAG: hypothetical protein BGO49_10030 [Planctomycetales bacterium 71-10]